MNQLSLMVFLALTALVLAVSTLLAIVITRNLGVGLRYHRALASRLKELRLGKMLSALGLDKDVYLKQNSDQNIEKQLQRCTRCGRTATCDEKLASDNVDADGLVFCDNEADLVRAVAKIKLDDKKG